MMCSNPDCDRPTVGGWSHCHLHVGNIGSTVYEDTQIRLLQDILVELQGLRKDMDERYVQETIEDIKARALQ